MIHFIEVLPNPSGRDTDGEWIKIINGGDGSVDLTGWTISDAGGKTFSFNGLSIEQRKLDKGEKISIGYKATGINLNNSGDTLTLRDSTGGVVDEISYTGPVADDEIIFAQDLIQGVANDSNAPRLDNLALIEQAGTVGIQSVTPIFIAIAISVVSGLGIGAFVKGVFSNRN